MAPDGVTGFPWRASLISMIVVSGQIQHLVSALRPNSWRQQVLNGSQSWLTNLHKCIFLWCHCIKLGNRGFSFWWSVHTFALHSLQFWKRNIYFQAERWGFSREALKAAQQLIRFLLTQPHLSVTLFLHAHIHTGSIPSLPSVSHTLFSLSLWDTHKHFDANLRRGEDSSLLTTEKDRHVYLYLFREVRFADKSPLTE